MPPRTPPTKGVRRTRDRAVKDIFEVATHLFAEKGYRATTMRDIGQALGIHAGSVYAHVESKDDILFDIVQRISEIHDNALKEIQALDVSPVEKLRAVARAHIRLIAQNLEASTVYFHEWKNLDTRKRSRIIAQRDTFEEGIREMVQGCIDDGTFREVDVSLTVKGFLGMMNWTYQWYRPRGALSSEEIADTFVAMFIDALTAPKSSARGRTAVRRASS